MSRRTRISRQINTPDNIDKATKTWQLILAGCSLVGAGLLQEYMLAIITPK